jgi:hypothetical protein
MSAPRERDELDDHLSPGEIDSLFDDPRDDDGCDHPDLGVVNGRCMDCGERLEDGDAG